MVDRAALGDCCDPQPRPLYIRRRTPRSTSNQNSRLGTDCIGHHDNTGDSSTQKPCAAASKSSYFANGEPDNSAKSGSRAIYALSFRNRWIWKHRFKSRRWRAVKLPKCCFNSNPTDACPKFSKCRCDASPANTSPKSIAKCS